MKQAFRGSYYFDGSVSLVTNSRDMNVNCFAGLTVLVTHCQLLHTCLV